MKGIKGQESLSFSAHTRMLRHTSMSFLLEGLCGLLGNRDSGADLTGLEEFQEELCRWRGVIPQVCFPVWDLGKKLQTEIKYVFDYLMPLSHLQGT